MGMQGTGSKRIVVEDAFVPSAPRHHGRRAGVAAEPADRPTTTIRCISAASRAFLIGEAASVAVGAARGALDLYEECCA